MRRVSPRRGSREDGRIAGQKLGFPMLVLSANLTRPELQHGSVSRCRDVSAPNRRSGPCASNARVATDLAVPLSWGESPFRPVTLRPLLSQGLPLSALRYDAVIIAVS